MYNLGDYMEAMEFYREAINSMAAVSGKGHEMLMNSTSEHKRRVALKIVQAKERLQNRRHLLELESDFSHLGCSTGALCFMKVFKLDHPREDSSPNNDYPIVLYNMSVVRLLLGSFSTARQMLELALSLLLENKSSTPGSFRSFLAVSINLGWIYQRELRHEQAINIYERGLQRTNRADVIGIECNRRIMSTMLYNMAILKIHRGSHHEAVKLLDKCVSLLKEAIGDDAAELSSMLFKIGEVQLQVGFAVKAMDSFLECLSIRRLAHGNTHHLVAEPLFQIGKVHELLGEEIDALNVYEETVRVEKEALGSIHLDVAYTLGNIGRIYHERRDWEKALSALREALSIAKECLGDNHMSVAILHFTIGKVSQEYGMIEESYEEFSEAKRIAKLLEFEVRNPENDFLEGLIDFSIAFPPAAACA